MITLVGLYLTFGIGFYFGVALTRLSTFKKATPDSILRGLVLGVLLWPLGMMVLSNQRRLP